MSVRSISVSPAERRRAREFAELLDGSRPATGHELESLVALTATLLPEQFIPGITPRAEFRAGLRESLVAQATDRQPSTEVARAADRPAARQHRVRTIVVTGVLASLVGGVGAAAASTHALPGDALYGLKRGLESVQLKFDHSDLSRGRDLLDQADNRLSEAEDLAASEDARSPRTMAQIAATIADLEAASRAGADALNASYADTGDLEPLVELHRFAVDQRERLADLSTLLSPAQRELLAPLSDLLLTLQVRAERLLDGTSALTTAPRTTGTRDARKLRRRGPARHGRRRDRLGDRRPGWWRRDGWRRHGRGRWGGNVGSYGRAARERSGASGERSAADAERLAAAGLGAGAERPAAARAAPHSDVHTRPAADHLLEGPQPDQPCAPSYPFMLVVFVRRFAVHSQIWARKSRSWSGKRSEQHGPSAAIRGSGRTERTPAPRCLLRWSGPLHSHRRP